MLQRTKRSRHLLGRLGCCVLLLVVIQVVATKATEDANTSPPHPRLRSLQANERQRFGTDHRKYESVCYRRSRGEYLERNVLDYEVQNVMEKGGGYKGETIPDMPGYVFGEQCQPTRASSCGTDTRTCSDGRTVARDPQNGCSFFPCPRAHCCNANERPQCSSFSWTSSTTTTAPERPQCCPTGTWACPGLFGSYYCGPELGNIRADFGPVCATFGTAAVATPPQSPPAAVVTWSSPSSSSFAASSPPVNCNTCNGCGYFDGCNTCSCDNNGFPDCTNNNFCPTASRQEPRCFDCSAAASAQQQIREPPPPSCSSCSCGFFDGCNRCACNRDGTSICTLRACGPFELGTPHCNECQQQPEIAPAAPIVVANCETCPCGYNDGCNVCRCSSGGGPSGGCSRMFCDSHDTPFCLPCSTNNNPRGATTTTCSRDTRTCPDGSTVRRDPAHQCTFTACPVAVVMQQQPCRNGGYRQCPNGQWVAKDPSTGCTDFFPCRHG